MSSCQCCLTSHPLRLIERLSSSIQTIKLIRTNCSIFENILLDEYEHLERISSNLNRYLIHYGTISNEISQFTKQLNNRLENLTKVLHELECLTRKCSIWLKNNSVKGIRSQLKHYGKQLDTFIRFVEQHSYIIQYKNTFWKDFSIFQINYHQQCLQMDLIEREHMKLFIESIRLFSSIISPGKRISTINIDRDINEWKEKNKFRITWLPDEHHQKETTDLIEAENKPKLVEESSSDIEIKAIDNSSNDRQENYAYKSNLSWSFTIAKKKEDLLVGYLFSFQMKKLLAGLKCET